MKNRGNLAGFLAVAFLICLAAGAPATVSGADVSLGLGVGMAPDYIGGDDYEAVPIPLFSATWENHMSVEWVGGKATANLIPSPVWRLGPTVEYIAKRDDDVDDDKVSRMESVDAAVMTGALLGFEIDTWHGNIEAMWDLADGNDGNIYRINLGFNIPVGERGAFGLEAFTTYADSDFMESYFAVSPKDSVRSGLPEYKADSDLYDWGFNVSAGWSPWGNWSLLGLGSWKRLMGDADDSPVVDDQGSQYQWFGGIVVAYTWGKPGVPDTHAKPIGY